MALFPKTLPLSNGRLVTALDATQIGDNFQKLENLRYDPELKGVKGMTKINTTPLIEPKIKAGTHFRKVSPQTESHTLLQAFNSGETTSSVYDSTDVIPGTGSFTSLRVDSSGATVGKFAETPVESVAYCNGQESLIWSGDRLNVSVYMLADVSSTKANFISTNRADFLNHTSQVRNTLSTEYSKLSDSTETQIFVGSTQKLKTIYFTLLAGSPNRFQTPTIQYWDGSAWTSVTTLVDGTDVGGFSLVQSGGMTFDDTQSLAETYTLDGIQLFWYRVTFGSYSSVAGDIKISHVNLSANMQPIIDLWDGGDIPLATFQRVSDGEYGGNDVVNIAENSYDSLNNITFVDIGESLGDSELSIPSDINTSNGLFFRPDKREIWIYSTSKEKFYQLDDCGNLEQTVDISGSLGVGEVVYGFYIDTAGKFTVGTNQNVLTFSSTGSLLGTNAITEYDAVAGLARDVVVGAGGGTEWIIDSTTNKVYRVTILSGFTVFSSFSLPFTPSSIRFKGNPEVNFMIADANAAKEYEYTQAGVLVDTITLPAIPVSISGDYLMYSDSGSGKLKVGKLLPAVGGIRVFSVATIRVGSFIKLSGLKLNFIPENTNDIPQPPFQVKANTQSSATPISVSGLTDTTSNDEQDTPFSRTGLITWSPISEQEEIQVSVEGVSLYTYDIDFGGLGVSVGTKLYYVAGIPSPKSIKAYSVPILAHDRLWLCDNIASDRNEVIMTSQFTDSVFNGEDVISFSVGAKTSIVAGAEIDGGLVLCKDRETWVIRGNSPADWIIKNISREIGCSSPLTMKSINMTSEKGNSIKVAIWQSAEGVYVCDGFSVSKMSNDIQDLFDANNTTKLNNIGIANAFIDVIKDEYHLIYPEGTSVVNDSEKVFDFEKRMWYTINRGVGNELSTGIKVTAQNGDYYNYGANVSGFAYRLENGNSFDGGAIVQAFRTGDIKVAGDSVNLTLLRRVNLLAASKNTTINKINATHYGDTSNTGTSFTLDVTDSTHRIKTSRADINTGVHSYHSLELSLSTDDEPVGFEPKELTMILNPIRKEK